MVNTNCEKTDIAGASFTISPMTDDFVAVILNALERVNTDKVWIKTDDVSTVVRGKMTHVFDVTNAIFLQAAHTGVHVSFQATYSLGCPGDSAGDVYLAEDDVPANEARIKNQKQYAAAKFSLYPLGGENYMDTIYKQIEAMKAFVDVTHSHYSTRLDGDTNAIFKGLEAAFRATVESGSKHTVMTVSLSANSPSHK
ncbi:YkoF family thiamine/hydroxymethylpyrimidine-binding protein [Virgibacillus sp. W0430]|uniref:YkoF family thiamine/hydroxymethylpyrimidine-binding protein n=1 Tax=Virgibacillus sp. W0430 TaxID=3391580 RepID=UPI003F4464BB